MGRPLRIGVVSPFLDKKHGTERCVIEQVERLARNHACEIVLYSQDVEDIALSDAQPDASYGRVTWRKIPDIPGALLNRYVWFFLANHAVRWRDRRKGIFTPDVLYSPGINCFDANVISVHIVFAEFYARVRNELSLYRNPFRSWPLLLHRKMYYRLIMVLEQCIYRQERTALTTVSNKVAEVLQRRYERKNPVCVIHHGVDEQQFNPAVRERLRLLARQSLNLPDSAYVLLLVGNGWKNKGLGTLLRAITQLQNPAISALIVGRDDPTPYLSFIRSRNLERQVLFLPVRSDVEWYYAAADAYIGPSLNDAFALPPLEAMACGVSAVVSRQAGISEIVTHGVDGLIIENPEDCNELASLLQTLISGSDFSRNIAANGARTARKYTWDKNAERLHTLFLQIQENRTAEAFRD